MLSPRPPAAPSTQSWNSKKGNSASPSSKPWSRQRSAPRSWRSAEFQRLKSIHSITAAAGVGLSSTAFPSLKQLALLSPATNLMVPDSSAQKTFIVDSGSTGTAISRYFDAGAPSHPDKENRYPLLSSLLRPGTESASSPAGDGGNRFVKVHEYPRSRWLAA